MLCSDRVRMLHHAPTQGKAVNPFTIYPVNTTMKPRNTRLLVTPHGTKSSIVSVAKMNKILTQLSAKKAEKNSTDLILIEVEKDSPYADGCAHLIKELGCMVSPLNMSDDLTTTTDMDASTFIISTSWAKQRNSAAAQAST